MAQTPPHSPSRPRTPLGLRNRHSMAGEFVSSSSVSPTSTLSDSAPTSVGPIRLNDVSRPSLRNVVAASGGPLRSKPTIRANPSLLTCFDPADEELYTLWAPKLKA